MVLSPPIAFADYLLLERIGVGGTAEIFRAVRRGRRPGDKPVALKRLLPHIAENPELRRLLAREVGALARMEHPCVPRLLDHGEHHGLPYLVMELVDGRSLRDLLGTRQARRATGSRLPVCVALWIAREISRGLGEATRCGIVHRDLSPTNVQITARGEVKILDFGIARVAGLAQTSHGGSRRGKWAYSSPEQIDGRPIDGRSDLFALGSLLFEMLTGRPPFLGATHQETMGRVLQAEYPGLGDGPWDAVAGQAWMPAIEREEVDPLLRTLLARDPAARPARCDAVSRAIAQLLGPSALTSAHVAEAGLYTYWLAQAVAALPPPPEVRSTVAAEHRGAEVTDPADEGVTKIG